MVHTFLKVYMELCSYFLFLQEQIKDIIIIIIWSKKPPDPAFCPKRQRPPKGFLNPLKTRFSNKRPKNRFWTLKKVLLRIFCTVSVITLQRMRIERPNQVQESEQTQLRITHLT